MLATAGMRLIDGARFDDVDVVVPVDSDMCRQWDARGFFKALNLRGSWAGVTANGLGAPRSNEPWRYLDWFAWDQPANGAMLAELGVGESVPLASLTEARLLEAMERALHGGARVAARAKEVAEEMRARDVGAAGAARLVERVAATVDVGMMAAARAANAIGGGGGGVSPSAAQRASCTPEDSELDVADPEAADGWGEELD